MIMKRSRILVVGGMIIILVFMLSCQNEESNPVMSFTESIVGTYKGTITKSGSGNVFEAMADVIKSDNNIVEIHCYSDLLDSAFVMEVFENGDSLALCNIGDDFTNQYGHSRMNEHHMMGNSGEKENWKHHMDEEHDQDDDHFGGFNMNDHSFFYEFEMEDNHGGFTLEFKGKKQ